LGGNAPGPGARAGISRGAAQSVVAPQATTRHGAPPDAPSVSALGSLRANGIPQPSALPASATPTPEGSAAGPQVASAAPKVNGISEEQVAEIKSAIQSQQKFLAELVEHGIRWELEGPELRIYFSPEKRAFAEMLESSASREKVRAASSTVLGRAVRVCAKLEAVAAAAASASRSGPATQELRAQFERDPMVKSMLQRFGGRIAEVKHRPEEP
jgi:hypothetical protein